MCEPEQVPEDLAEHLGALCGWACLSLLHTGLHT